MMKNAFYVSLKAVLEKQLDWIGKVNFNISDVTT